MTEHKNAEHTETKNICEIKPASSPGVFNRGPGRAKGGLRGGCNNVSGQQKATKATRTQASLHVLNNSEVGIRLACWAHGGRPRVHHTFYRPNEQSAGLP